MGNKKELTMAGLITAVTLVVTIMFAWLQAGF
jgi:hypothetical protein